MMTLSMSTASRRATRGLKCFILLISSVFTVAYVIVFYDRWSPPIDQTGRQKPYERTEPRTRKKLPSVLILTLLHNSEQKLPNYFRMIQSLSYPKELITLVLGEDNSKDRTRTAARARLKELSGYWRVAFHHLSPLEGRHKGWGTQPHAKHYRNIQLKRRRHIAMARNLLLSHALYDEEYVLWIDSDVEDVPRDLIQQLLSADKDLIVPNCLIRYQSNVVLPYDLSSWRETQASLAFQASNSPQYLFLEGYRQQRPRRTYLNDLKREGQVVQLDGVGSCVLLVKSVHFRLGLRYPAFVFKNQIETEGLAKMAAAMNISAWGMPYLEVLHACDYESAHWKCPT